MGGHAAQHHGVQGVQHPPQGEAAEEGGVHQGIDHAPEHQGHGHPQQIAEQQVGPGEGLFGVQQEHARAHDKYRDAPVGQAVPGVEEVPVRGPGGEGLQPAAGDVDHDDGQTGEHPQQIGIGQPALVASCHGLRFGLPVGDDLDPVAVGY